MVASPWPTPERAEPAPPPAEPDDARLVERLVAHDAEALAALYDRYARLAFSVALRILRSRERAEEVIQDVFVKLWREPTLFDPARGAFRSWLLRVVHHRAVDELRQRHRELVQRADDPEGTLWLGLPDPGPSPDESAVASLDREAILDALEQLVPAQRAAIELAYFDGLTQSEIAAQLGQPLGTVKTRIRLGMRRLRELLTASRLRLEPEPGTRTGMSRP